MKYMLVVTQQMEDWANALAKEYPVFLYTVLTVSDVKDTFQIMNPLWLKWVNGSRDEQARRRWRTLPQCIKSLPSLVNLMIRYPRTDVIAGKSDIEDFLYNMKLMEE